VAVSGDTVIVGAIGESSSSMGVNSAPNGRLSGSGAAYIFTGLGPIAPESLRVSVSYSEGNLLISFPSAAGKSYTLWRSNTLAPGSWVNTGLPALSGDGTIKTFTTVAPVLGVPTRFFRAQVGP